MYSYELYHYGIRGQRHGVRRFQNEDGSLTEAGRRRYSDGSTERRSRANGSSGGMNATETRRSSDDRYAVGRPGEYHGVSIGEADGSRVSKVHDIMDTRFRSRRQEEFRISEKGDKDIPNRQIAYAIGHYQKKPVRGLDKAHSSAGASSLAVSRARNMPMSAFLTSMNTRG